MHSLQVTYLAYIPVPRDGNCLFHALTLYESISPELLRVEVATYLEPRGPHPRRNCRHRSLAGRSSTPARTARTQPRRAHRRSRLLRHAQHHGRVAQDDSARVFRGTAAGRCKPRLMAAPVIQPMPCTCCCTRTQASMTAWCPSMTRRAFLPAWHQPHPPVYLFPCRDAAEERRKAKPRPRGWKRSCSDA